MAGLAEYRHRLAVEPLTEAQLGAIHGEFRRLGFHVRYDRPERLRLTAELAGTPVVDTTNDLTMGEAGRVIRALRGGRTIAEVYDLARPEPRRGWLAAFVAMLIGDGP